LMLQGWSMHKFVLEDQAQPPEPSGQQVVLLLEFLPLWPLQKCGRHFPTLA